MAYTGRGEVFINAYSNCTINGKSYKKGDLVVYLNDTEFQVEFASKDTRIKSNNVNRLNHFEINPNTVIITTDGFKKAVWNFIGKDLNVDVHYEPTFEKADADGDGRIFLNAVEGSIRNVAVYQNSSDNKIEDYTVVQESNSIEDLEALESYYIYYEKERTIKAGYKVATPSTNFFSINFVQNKRSIEVPKVGFASTPSLEFNDENFIRIPLEFVILNEEVHIYEFD